MQNDKLAIEKRTESAKNGRGFSKIYNVTFKEMKVGK